VVTLQDVQRWQAEYEHAANGAPHLRRVRELAQQATSFGLPGLLDMVALCRLAEVALALARETKQLRGGTVE